MSKSPATNAAIMVLLECAELPTLRGIWSADGPSDRVFDTIDGIVSASPVEIVMLRVAVDLRNGMGKARFFDVISVLSAKQIALAMSLAEASRRGGDAVTQWVAAHRRAQQASLFGEPKKGVR